MNNGWIKLFRKIEDCYFWQDSQAVHLWIQLLLMANHKEKDILISGKKITLKAGQFICSRNTLSAKTKISESKIQRLLKLFENEQQIEQQTNNKYRIISVTNWQEYQMSEQQNEQQVNNTRTTGEQQVNTDNNIKNDKNIKKEINKEKKDELFSLFKEAWKKYPTKCKRSAETEFEHLQNKHKDWKEVVPLLKEAVAKFAEIAIAKKEEKGTTIKHMQGWITDRRWEMYLQEDEEPEKPKSLKPVVGEDVDLSKWGTAK